ncbi:hypothetical protein HDV00_008266 [Rhizophlyctis rosea]|nr:hypothetical protein HDV00_008266 [Rhizophlyctis rosea]
MSKLPSTHLPSPYQAIHGSTSSASVPRPPPTAQYPEAAYAPKSPYMYARPSPPPRRYSYVHPTAPNGVATGTAPEYGAQQPYVPYQTSHVRPLVFDNQGQGKAPWMDRDAVPTGPGPPFAGAGPPPAGYPLPTANPVEARAIGDYARGAAAIRPADNGTPYNYGTETSYPYSHHHSYHYPYEAGRPYGPAAPASVSIAPPPIPVSVPPVPRPAPSTPSQVDPYSYAHLSANGGMQMASPPTPATPVTVGSAYVPPYAPAAPGPLSARLGTTPPPPVNGHGIYPTTAPIPTAVHAPIAQPVLLAHQSHMHPQAVPHQYPDHPGWQARPAPAGYPYPQEVSYDAKHPAAPAVPTSMQVPAGMAAAPATPSMYHAHGDGSAAYRPCYHSHPVQVDRSCATSGTPPPGSVYPHVGNYPQHPVPVQAPSAISDIKCVQCQGTCDCGYVSAAIQGAEVPTLSAHSLPAAPAMGRCPSCPARCECGAGLAASIPSTSGTLLSTTPIPMDVDKRSYYTPNGPAAPFAASHLPPMERNDVSYGPPSTPGAQAYGCDCGVNGHHCASSTTPHPMYHPQQYDHHSYPVRASSAAAAYLMAPVSSSPTIPTYSIPVTHAQGPKLPSFSSVVQLASASPLATPNGNHLPVETIPQFTYVSFATGHAVGRRDSLESIKVEAAMRFGAGGVPAMAMSRHSSGNGSGSGSGDDGDTPTPPPIPAGSGALVQGKHGSYDSGRSVRFHPYGDDVNLLRQNSMSSKASGSTAQTPTPASTPRIELPYPVPFANSPTTMTPPSAHAQLDGNDGAMSFVSNGRGRNGKSKTSHRSRSNSRGRSSRIPSLASSPNGSMAPPPLPSDRDITTTTTAPTHTPSSSHKRYACPTCSKRFSRPSSLKTHIHSHTGERPYVCGGEGGTTAGCGRRFSVLSNLRRHMRGCRGRVLGISGGADEDGSERGGRKRGREEGSEGEEGVKRRKEEDGFESEGSEDADGEGSPDDGDVVAGNAPVVTVTV